MSEQVPTQRQRLLDCLVQPCRTAEIAETIGRSASHAAGVLAALMRAGTVVRLERGCTSVSIGWIPRSAGSGNRCGS